MLIKHPTDGATHVFVFNSNHEVALRIDALFVMERRPYGLRYSGRLRYIIFVFVWSFTNKI